MYTFEIGKHHCVVMDQFDAMNVAAGCIMDTFNYRNDCGPNSDRRLAVLEDQHAIGDSKYILHSQIVEIPFEQFLLEEAAKNDLEFTPINEYPELLYDATKHLTLGLISHYLHDLKRDCISDIKFLMYHDDREDVRHAIVDAFNYFSTHVKSVYEINSWYYNDQ